MSSSTQQLVTMAREQLINSRLKRFTFARSFRIILGSKMRNHKTEDEDEDGLKETGETNSTIWMLIDQNRAKMKTALGVFVIARQEA